MSGNEINPILPTTNPVTVRLGKPVADGRASNVKTFPSPDHGSIPGPLTKAAITSQQSALNILQRNPLTAVEKNMLPPDSVNDLGYIEALELLKGSQIKIDKDLISKLTPEKAKNGRYISTLIALHNAGINIYGYLLEYLTIEKVKDSKYVDALKCLSKTGVPVNAAFIEKLTIEKAKDTPYLEVLKALCQVGVQIDGSLIEKLTLEKARDLTYINVLKVLQKAGILIDSAVIFRLTLEKGKDSEYIDSLITLHKAGIQVSGYLVHKLTAEKAKDEAYIEIIKDLQASNIQINSEEIISLTLEKSKDHDFIAALKTLRTEGLNISGALIDRFSQEKGKDPDYISALKALHFANIKVDYDLIDKLTLEKGKNVQYLSTLKELQLAGIVMTGILIDKLTVEKMKDARYISNLIALQNQGVPPDYALLDRLTLEKGNDTEYVSCLVKNRGDFNFTDKAFISLKYNINYQEILNDSKIKDMISLYQKVLDNPACKQIIWDDLKNMALHFVIKMNDLHEKSPAVRLKEVAGLSAGELFSTIVSGEEEAYTSTFNLLFKQLLLQCKQEKLDGMSLLKKSDLDGAKYPVFFMMAANYGRLKEFLETFSVNDRVNILKDFVDRFAGSPDKIKHAIAITETLMYEKDPEIRKVIEDQLMAKVQDKGLDPEIKKVYEVIGSVYCANTEPQGHKDDFDKLQKMHKVEPKETLKVPVDKDGEIIEQMYFYNDKDGKSSYDNFKISFKSWQIEDNGSYVILSKQQNGKTVKIYANKPQNEYGSEKIREILRQNNKHVSIIVHRGHSYHTKETLNQITGDAVLVYLGSCGGFSNLNAVYNKSKQAQIIATKGTGSYEINDPMLKAINEGLFQPEINWRKLGPNVMGQLKKWGVDENRAGMYVLPYQNVGLDIIDLMKRP